LTLPTSDDTRLIIGKAILEHANSWSWSLSDGQNGIYMIYWHIYHIYDIYGHNGIYIIYMIYHDILRRAYKQTSAEWPPRNPLILRSIFIDFV
jgi:hypothetical protein